MSVVEYSLVLYSPFQYRRVLWSTVRVPSPGRRCAQLINLTGDERVLAATSSAAASFLRDLPAPIAPVCAPPPERRAPARPPSTPGKAAPCCARRMRLRLDASAGALVPSNRSRRRRRCVGAAREWRLRCCREHPWAHNHRRTELGRCEYSEYPCAAAHRHPWAAAAAERMRDAAAVPSEALIVPTQVGRLRSALCDHVGLPFGTVSVSAASDCPAAFTSGELRGGGSAALRARRGRQRRAVRRRTPRRQRDPLGQGRPTCR